MNAVTCQWIVAGLIAVFVLGPPMLRTVMMAAGAKGFVPWGEFTTNHLWQTGSLLILAGVLFAGGFWN